MVSANWLRNKWIDFFKERGHFDVSNRSLVPSSSDKSLLFINSGIAAIKEYFYGDQESPAPRLVSCQKVIRTGDIDAIGDSFRHHTYFEMLGNFSIGDYFKKEAINWAWEFLTKEINLDSNKLFITVYEKDQEAFDEWKKIIPEERIVKGTKKTNFWDMGVGPCGPCTEIYFDKGDKYDPEKKGILLLKNDIDNERFLEVWNIVFSEYLNNDGTIVKSKRKNIDTGAGLERILSILENKDSNFETSLFFPIIDYLSKRLEVEKKSLWAPTDYFRTSCLLLNEGIGFGNKGREYVLRRIFRKSLFFMKDSKIDREFFVGLVDSIVSTLPYYQWDSRFIVNSMLEEYLLYEKIQNLSIGLLNELMDKYPDLIPAEEIFNLVSSRGLEYWTIEKILQEKGKSFDKKEYENLDKQHKEVSFNSNISSAFIKKIPTLLEFKLSSVMDYGISEKKSKIIALFDENFSPVNELKSGYLVLDSTVIFPISGGQDSDDGKINGTAVEESFKAPNGQILHKINGHYSIGDFVTVSHDVEKRKYLEIHHTLEHLFFELLKREINPQIERYSGNKYRDYFNMEIKVPRGISRESFDLLDLNRKLNGVIDKHLDVNVSYISWDEYKQLGLPQNFEDVYRKSDSLRLVDIGGYSRELCFGTHVKNSKDIKKCLLVDFKKKQSNIYRFKVIGGDLVDFHLKGKTLEEFFSCGDDQEAKQRKALQKQRFNEEKEKLSREILDNDEKLMVINRNVGVELGLETFKELGRKIVEKTVFLFFEESPNIFRFFVISDVMDVSKLMKLLRDEYSWKCGGNPGFGSGVGYGEDFSEKVLVLLRK